MVLVVMGRVKVYFSARVMLYVSSTKGVATGSLSWT